jgi:hypothetical protein
VNAHDEIWFWGVSFLLTNRNIYGRAGSLEEAKAARRSVGWRYGTPRNA